MSVDVARWLGERLGAPFRHKYMLGPKDRKLKPAAGNAPGKRTDLGPWPPHWPQFTCLFVLHVCELGHRGLGPECDALQITCCSGQSRVWSKDPENAMTKAFGPS